MPLLGPVPNTGDPVRDLATYRRLPGPPLSTPADRTPARYRLVLDRLGVTTHPWLQPNTRESPTRAGVIIAAPGTTWCNAAVWRWTQMLGAEVPHWVMLDDAPAPDFAKGARELNGNGVALWLTRAATCRDCPPASMPSGTCRLHPSGRWLLLQQAEAVAWARKGCPVVVAWHNPRGIGHVAMLSPDSPAKGEPLIYQAGSANLENAPLSRGFGNLRPLYFGHA